MTAFEMWTLLETYGIATTEEISLVTSIVGTNEKAMLDILYARTGYRNFEQYEEELNVMKRVLNRLTEKNGTKKFI